MSAQKSIVGLILFARNETSYNAGAFTLSGSTDTIDTVEQPLFQQTYALEGIRGPAMFGRGQLPRVAPNVRSVNASVKIHAKGSGATYTTLVKPPNVHPFLQACGMSGSLEGGTWVYRPTPLSTVPFSLAADVYGMSELLQLRGGYGTFTLDLEGLLPVFNFDVQGTQSGSVSDVANSAIPARVFQASNVIPPRLETIGLTIGAYSPKVRKIQYTHGLSISPRMDLNASGSHAGFAIGRQDNKLTMTIEADLLSNFDPYGDWNTAASKTITATVGTVANNKFTMTVNGAALSSVVRAADGDVAMYELTYEPSTAADQNTDVSFTWS